MSGDDSKLLDYVIKHTDARFDSVESRCGEIEEKVDQLLQFKWQIISGSVLLSTIAGIAFQIILALLAK